MARKSERTWAPESRLWPQRSAVGCEAPGNAWLSVDYAWKSVLMEPEDHGNM